MARGLVLLSAVALWACSAARPGDEPIAAPAPPDLPQQSEALDAGEASADAGEPERPRFPSPDWEVGAPAEHGFDPAGLDAAGSYAESIGSWCLLVIRDGTLVYERYWNGATPVSVQRSWSIAKSFTSALIGVALARGEIQSVEQPAADFIPGWRNTDKAGIRIRDLLSGTSGLYWGPVSDYSWTLFDKDQTASAVALEVSDPPGEVWHYNNHAVQAFDALLEGATGMDPEAYAEAHLWGPLGMNLEGPKEARTHWDRDRAGNVTTYQSVFASCRDMARLGHLFLHRGSWNGRQLLPADYVEAALTPSQPHNRVYGYLWWLNGGTPAFDAYQNQFEGTFMPHAPSDLFSAQGLGQNFVDVVPSTKTVYVHMRRAPHDPYLTVATDPVGTAARLTEDSKRHEHRELMRRLLDATR